MRGRRGEFLQKRSPGGRLFGGELAPLVAHYAQHRALSPKDVARLRRLIEAMEAEDE